MQHYGAPLRGTTPPTQWVLHAASPETMTMGARMAFKSYCGSGEGMQQGPQPRIS